MQCTLRLCYISLRSIVIYFYFKKQLDYLQTINYAFWVAAKILVQFFYFQLDHREIFSCESAKNLSTVYIHNMQQSPCPSCLFPEAWVHPKFLFTTVLLSNRYCCPKLCSLILPLESQTLNCQLQLSSSLKAIEMRFSPFPVPLYRVLIFLQMWSAFFPLFSNWGRMFCFEFFFLFFFFCPEFSIFISRWISSIRACSVIQKADFRNLDFGF